MSKKFLQLFIFSGLGILTLLSARDVTFAAADTNCKEQQDKCNWRGCDRLEEKEAIAKCKVLAPGDSWFSNGPLIREACYQGCLIDQEKGSKDKVKGCHFTSCQQPPQQ